MYHVPMCLNCGEWEVVGQYSDGYGEGFCSRACRDEAHQPLTPTYHGADDLQAAWTEPFPYAAMCSETYNEE